MKQADQLSRELLALDKQHGTASYNTNADISDHTKEGYLKQQERQINKLYKKYGVIETLVKTLDNGIKLYEQRCADGSYVGRIHR